MSNGKPAGAEKKIPAAILALIPITGALGIHKFYTDRQKEGIIHLILGLICGLGYIIGLIEGIIYLTKSDEEFVATYITGKKGWF